MYNDDRAVRIHVSVSVSEARQRLSDLINRVAYGSERITVVRHGRAVAAIVPMSDINRLEGIDARVRAGERQSVVAPAAQPVKPASNPRSAGPRP